MDQAKRAGAKVIKLAQKTFWGGYAGYFQDPQRNAFPQEMLIRGSKSSEKLMNDRPYL